ncbi:MAG: chromate efflux transporter [Gammaproteobacteria bacterium]|nr:chromate efflux transporter [Gammaproteobacteria bacterium]
MSSSVVLKNANNEYSYWILFFTFLKIGSTAFGGFMALISVVQNYVVERKKLLSQEEMLDGVSLATLLPGPVAVNVVAYVGYKIRGIWGAAICFTAVILPSFFLILGLSYAYFKWGSLPAVNNIFNGVLPAVAAIITVAAFNMGRKTFTGSVEILFAVSAMLGLILVGGFYSTVIIMALSGLIGLVLFKRKDNQSSHIDKSITKNLTLLPSIKVSSAAIVLIIVFIVALLKSNALISAKLFISFSSMSLFLFGGGFVFIPMIQEIVVDSYGWVTQKEFIDGIALGQVTPGPILISATFIGYKVAGLFGAVAATIGIFVPPAILMLICTHFLDKLKSSENIKAILKGIRCGVIGMIAAAAYVVLLSAMPGYISIIIFVLSLAALLMLKLEVVWIIPAAGIIGFLIY